jgi:hypothetical protein
MREAPTETKLVDILGEVSSLATAIQLAARGLENSAHMCAFDVLAHRVASLAEAARCIIDDMEASQ